MDKYYQMYMIRLLKDELKYELNIRGLDPKDKTVAEVRATLRPLLRMESLNHPLSYPEFSLEVEDEFKTIEDKFNELSAFLQQLISSKKYKNVPHLHTRFTHVLKRADRLPAEKLTAEQIKQRSDILCKILEKFDALDKLSRTSSF